MVWVPKRFKAVFNRGGIEDTRLKVKDTKKNLRPRTALPRTDPPEAKDRDAQGQGPRTQVQVLSKKKGLQKKISKRSPEKTVVRKNFQALHKLLTTQKIVLSSIQGQGYF